MADPQLLLLDEPSMGLSPILTREIFSLIKTINEEKGISILLVEQNAHMALDYSARAYVLETGRIVMEGQVGGCQVQSGGGRGVLWGWGRGVEGESGRAATNLLF